MGKAEEFGFFLTRTFATTRNRKKSWPFIPGKYFVHDTAAPVAVTTLGSVDLAKEVSNLAPKGLCIVGKVETENIGIEKIIKNVLSNQAIRYLVCAGAEPPKHMTGATMVALFQNGTDEFNRVIGSPGMRPVLPNTSHAEVDEFRKRIEPIDMVGETDAATIAAKIRELAALTTERGGEIVAPHEPSSVERFKQQPHDPKYIKLDKAGYFVINVEDGYLLIEHFDYKENLLRTIEGDSARDLYLTIIESGWVSRLDHAAYLGRQLAKAEIAMNGGPEFLQDGA